MPSTLHLLPYYHHDYAWCNSRSWHIWRYIQHFTFGFAIADTAPSRTFWQTVERFRLPIEKPVMLSPNTLSFSMRPAEIVTLHMNV